MDFLFVQSLGLLSEIYQPKFSLIKSSLYRKPLIRGKWLNAFRYKSNH